MVLSSTMPHLGHFIISWLIAKLIFEYAVNCPLLSSSVGERHFQGRDVGVIPSHNCHESIYGLPLSD